MALNPLIPLQAGRLGQVSDPAGNLLRAENIRTKREQADLQREQLGTQRELAQQRLATQRQKLGMDQEEREYNRAMQATRLAGQLMGGVTPEGGQNSWTSGIRRWAQLTGLNPADAGIPEQYTPEAAEELRRQAMTLEQQLTEAYRERQLGLQERRVGAIERGAMKTDIQIPIGGQTGPQFGKIPQGMMLRETAEGGYVMEPVPGSPEAVEREQVAQKAAGRKQISQRYGGVVLEDLGRAKELVKDSPILTTGVLGNVLQNWAGTKASDLRNLFDGIESQVAFERLQQMRDASPNGSALGAVSERELNLLQSALGSLRQSQNSDQLLFNIDRMEKTFNEVIHGDPRPHPRTPQEAAKLPSGTEFVDPMNNVRIAP